MKKVPNSKNYFVCEQGFIYRNGRRLQTNRDTYLTVSIGYLDGTRKEHFVHRIVAQVYIPNPENKPMVNHIDGNKQNNAVSNLEWVTAKENAEHAARLGLRKSGSEAPNAILTDEQVHEICKMLSEGRRVKDIKDSFCVSQSVISMIKMKKQYVEIASQYEFPSRGRAVSDETLRWVCHCIEQGMTNQEIKDLYHGEFPRVFLSNVRCKTAYLDIIKDFNF